MKHGALADNVDLYSICGAPARKADLTPDVRDSGVLHPASSLTVGAGLWVSSTPGAPRHDGLGTDVALTALQACQGRGSNGSEAVATLAGGGLGAS